MKEEIKERFNKAKEYVVEHKEDIIGLCAASVISVAAGAISGRCIGKYINMTNAEAYKNGWQKGMADFYSGMMTDNFDNADVVKALVDFNIKHAK